MVFFYQNVDSLNTGIRQPHLGHRGKEIKMAVVAERLTYVIDVPVEREIWIVTDGDISGYVLGKEVHMIGQSNSSARLNLGRKKYKYVCGCGCESCPWDLERVKRIIDHAKSLGVTGVVIRRSKEKEIQGLPVFDACWGYADSGSGRSLPQGVFVNMV